MAQDANIAVAPALSAEQPSPGVEATRGVPASAAPLTGNNNEYEAADALAALANLGSVVPYAPVPDHQPLSLRSPNDSLSDQKPLTHGHDTSHILSPSSNGGLNLPVAPDATQLREPGYVRDEPALSQVRQPSPAQRSIHDLPISPSKIKAEPSTTPRAFTPTATPQAGPMDNVPVVATAEAPKLVASGPSKKRSAPKSSGPKRAPGTKKPPSKKRKLEADAASSNGVANDRRSNTPSSRTRTPAFGGKGNKKSQSGTPIAGSSPAPAEMGSSDAEDSDSEDDNSLYCICRGKDDHTWMIGCESCDDWFHGRCVNLKKDEHEKLLAKFICPSCEQAGHGHTTWRPMCRREGCVLPAAAYTETKIIDGKRVETLTRSKYCSNECGITFFKNIIAAVSLTTGNGTSTQHQDSTKRKADAIDNWDEGFSDDEYEPPPRGGVLRARDLKSLVIASETIEAFHHLGSGFLSPPDTASPTNPDITNGGVAANGDGNALPYPLTEGETERLSELSAEKARLRGRRALLKDRERFITMTREAANRYAEREGMKPKEVCGYDTRLAWSEEEFYVWRNTAVGRASLAASTLEPTEEDISKANNDEDTTMAGGEVLDATVDIDALQTSRPQPCTRKRCERHKAWEKLHLHDLRFGEVEVGHASRKCESEEKDIREKAMVRWRREKAMEALKDHDSDSKRHGEGWVEVVG